MSPAWSYVLTAIGITGIYLAGRRNLYGWVVGLSAQVLCRRGRANTAAGATRCRHWRGRANSATRRNGPHETHVRHQRPRVRH